MAQIDPDGTATPPGEDHGDRRPVVRALHAIEKLLLILVSLMTLAAVAGEVAVIVQARTVTLGDILLMFLYAEVIAMTAVFYSGRGLPLVYPIFVAITALARLIVLQGKDMDPLNIVIEAAAILLLSVSVAILLKFRPGST
jgi:protein PsiE